mgnify:CR=1 FL=1
MKDSIYESFNLIDKINIIIIDDFITREIEWAEHSTDDIQNAWLDIKKILEGERYEL